jgi:uncharacterized linocin/CFP29 family protein
MSGENGFTADEARAVGENLGIDWAAFDVDEFRRGMDVELEHGLRDPETNVTSDDPLTTAKIALAHLKEYPDYYDRLDKMELEAEAFWEGPAAGGPAPEEPTNEEETAKPEEAFDAAREPEDHSQGEKKAMSKYLQRGDAPFGEGVWGQIDEVVIGAAHSQLSVRRIVGVTGPLGLELRHLPTKDQTVVGDTGISLSASGTFPVAQLSAGFTLPRRDLAAFEADGIEPDLGVVAEAAILLAMEEDKLLLYGSDALCVAGLTTAEGIQTVKLAPWTKVGAAADNLIEAVTALDKAGFHGPYALALAPDKYNLLYRRYPQSDGTELEHISRIVTGGVVKAPGLGEGGLLIAVGKQYAAVVIGQDIHAGYVGPTPELEYQFTISESLALQIFAPGAICVIK